LPAIGLNDQSNVFGALKFYRHAVGAGVKPIIGAELWVSEKAESFGDYRIVLLCQNVKGYRNLNSLVTKAYRLGHSQGVPKIQIEWMDSDSLEGLICLSGGMDGDLGRCFLSGQTKAIEPRIRQWMKLFGDRYFVEVTRINKDREEEFIQFIASICGKNQTPIVATNNVRFLQKSEFETHEARVCIQDAKILDDPRRKKLYTEEQYLKTEEEMCELFSDIPSALENSVNIAIRCNLSFDLDTYHLPEFPLSQDVNVDDFLQEKSRSGLAERERSGRIKGGLSSPEKRQIYSTRFEQELSVIKKMGFSGYFLIVADFIDWAKKNDIPVGPGRGSGAGSLIAFSLGITELDPIEYDLLFERFLNDERVSMPDFDIDFCMERRDEVIEYVSERYGKEKVAQIITHGTMAAKGVLRDVGRILGFPYGFTDQLAKLIPFELDMTLEKALGEEPVLLNRYKEEPDVKKLFDLAKELEGLSRNAGRHAGGLVIAPRPLTDFMPLYCEEASASVVTQFDMNDIESSGLVKFDFLGLRTLTIIDWAIKDVNRVASAKKSDELSILDIPLDDKETYELVQTGGTTAIFQLESRGMRELIRNLRPDCFDDLIALVALFRPGPLQSGMVDNFIDTKHGRSKAQYKHPSLEPILRVTNGVILYQEQVMEIARVLAGYTLGEADLLRRAMGKKKVDEMAFQRKTFIAGATNNGIPEEDSAIIFDLMEKFAGYGFNKSHSAAYALVAYQTAWLKAHHPAAFMAAVLSSDMDNTDKVVSLIEECRILGLNIVYPTIDTCVYRFSVQDSETIRYGLGALKGIGEGVIASIVIEREKNGAYLGLVDLCTRNSSGRLNRKALEVLIKAGALDCLGEQRYELMAGLEHALQVTEQGSRDSASGQVDLFGLPSDEKFADSNASGRTTKIVGQSVLWTQQQILTYEKETLGLYLSGHPIDKYSSELSAFLSCKLNAINSGKRRIAGLVSSIRTLNTRRGKMAIISLDDNTARIEVVLYRDVFERHVEKLFVDNIVVLETKCGEDRYSGEFRIEATEVMSIDDARNKLATGLSLFIKSRDASAESLTEAHKIISRHTVGRIPVFVDYEANSNSARLRLPATCDVYLSDDLLDDLGTSLGEDRVKLEYSDDSSYRTT
jgi:DNA polymerase-3 subunit alpha